MWNVKKLNFYVYSRVYITFFFHFNRASGGVRLSTGSNLVFIDSSSLRRTAAATAAVAAANHQEPHTMATTASCLARGFGIVVELLLVY